MRRTSGRIICMGVLLWSLPAAAQFENHSIGFDVGVIAPTPGVGIGPTLPVPALALDASLYFEGGFDLGFRFGLGIQGLTDLDHQVASIYPAFDFRYLLLQDYFRPYIGAELSFLYIFDDTMTLQTQAYVGIAPVAGFDYFFVEHWSIGASVNYALLGMLNAPVEGMFQGWVRVATHF
jgi:outer membrane protein